MNTREKRVRVLVTIGYFVTCFAGLYYYTYGSPFCSRQGKAGHVAQTLHLTLACTLWEVIVSICGALAAKQFNIRGVAPVVSTALAVIGFAPIPFWIYGSGRFLFEGTWLDVSCFFTEGYGMMFSPVVAPALALATLAGELVILPAESSPRFVSRQGPARLTDVNIPSSLIESVDPRNSTPLPLDSKPTCRLN